MQYKKAYDVEMQTRSKNIEERAKRNVQLEQMHWKEDQTIMGNEPAVFGRFWQSNVGFFT
jgi:hypothetical protein